MIKGITMMVASVAAMKGHHTITDGDLTADYWLEHDAETKEIKLVCKMIWFDF